MAEDPLIANAIVGFQACTQEVLENIGWTAVFGSMLIVISVLLSGIILLPFSGNFLKALSDPQNAATAAELASNPLYIILSAIVSALTFPLPVFACILYFRAKQKKTSLFIIPLTLMRMIIKTG